MQSALVKVIGKLGTFGLNSQTKEHARINPKDSMCLMVEGGKIISLKDETEVEDKIIQANQMVLVYPATPIKSTHYHLIVDAHPDLALAGCLAVPISHLVAPGIEDRVGLLVRASKKTDLSEIPYLFNLYQLD